MSDETGGGKAVYIAPAVLAQIEAIYASAGFTTAAAFVQHCLEKEIKRHQEAAEKVLAERLRKLGYLE